MISAKEAKNISKSFGDIYASVDRHIKQSAMRGDKSATLSFSENGEMIQLLVDELESLKFSVDVSKSINYCAITISWE